MTKQIDADEYYSPRQVAALTPGRPHVQTVWRWLLKGVRGRKLASVLIGGRRMVTGHDLLDFLGEGTTVSPSTPRTPAQATRASLRAADALAKAGW
mgnify:CR=1 FL=1